MLKETHKENEPQNKTHKLKENMNMDIWEVSTYLQKK